MSSLKISDFKRKATENSIPMSHPEPFTIYCHFDIQGEPKSRGSAVSGERLLAAEAMRLLMRLDLDLRDAHLDWNDDRFQRAMRARKRAVARLQRRWGMLDPQPAIALGSMPRRRPANIARYLIESGK